MRWTKKARISDECGEVACRACAATIAQVRHVLAARKELKARPIYEILFDVARDSAGWNTLRGRGRRRQHIEAVLQGLGHKKHRGRPALTLEPWRVAGLHIGLHLIIEHWYEQPPTRPGGPRAERHILPVRGWLHDVWQDAREALQQDDRGQFLTLKAKIVEQAVADLLGISARSVSRKVNAFAPRKPAA